MHLTGIAKALPLGAKIAIEFLIQNGMLICIKEKKVTE
jgi:phage antirepressor YoqD-like protein